AYVDEVYAIFHRDLVASKPCYKGRPVTLRVDPRHDGKVWAFWHCISDGPDEAERIPDPRRLERIAWIRPLIEHVGQPGLDDWVTERGSDLRTCLWLAESYLVVLAHRAWHYRLITAYC